MTGNTSERGYRKTVAIFLVAVMLSSVVALAVAGTAAADVDDINSLDAESGLIVGDDETVEQTVTLEKVQFDGEETINISADEIIGEAELDSVQDSGSHSYDDGSGFDEGSLDTAEVDGDVITLYHDADESLDVQVDVNLDLEDVTVDGASDEVTYTAEAENGTAEVTDTFELYPEPPEATGATVPADAPDELEIEFDEDVQVIGDIGDILDLEDEETENSVQVDSVEDVDGDTVIVGLDDYVESGDGESLTVNYEGDGENYLIAHAEQSEVEVDFDVDADNEAQPVFDSAEVDDDEPDEIEVTFSEDVEEVGGTDTIGDAFDLEGYELESGAAVDGDVTLTIEDDEINPNEDTTGVLSNTTDLSDELHAEDVSDAAIIEFENEDVENNVPPEFDSAEITADDPENYYLTVTFESDVYVDSDNVGTDTFELEGADTGAYVESGDDSVTVEVDPVEAGDEFDGDLDYSGDYEITSTAEYNPTAPEFADETVDNEVAPMIEDAEVDPEAEPIGSAVTVTFSEDVTDADVNLDAYSDTFTLENPDHNVHQVEAESDEVTLILEDEEGEPLQISETDEPVLSYEPEEENEPIVAVSDNDVPAEGFTNEDVQNTVFEEPTATLTYNADSQEHELEVGFESGITQSDTPSEIESAIDIQDTEDHSDIDLEGTFDEVDGNTITFTDVEDDYLHSDSTLEIEYDGNGVLEFEAVAEPEQGEEIAFENEIDVVIDHDYQTVSGDGSEVVVLFSENIVENDADEAFEFTGAAAPDVTGVAISENVATLTLEPNVEAGDDLGTLEYRGDETNNNYIESAESSDLAEDADIDVINNVGAAPVLESVYVDDVPEEMVLEFDRNVTATDDTGITLNTDNSLEVSAKTDGISNVETDGYENYLIVEYESSSDSEDSLIQPGDDTDGEDDVVLEIGEDNSIVSDDDTEAGVAPVDFHEIENEIAGELSQVESAEIEGAEILATEDDEQTHDFSVSLSGLYDSDGTQVIDADIDVEIGDIDSSADGDLGNVLDGLDTDEKDQLRFDNELEISSVQVQESDINSEYAGQEAEVTLDETDYDGIVTPDESDSVEFVHEAYTADVEGTFLTSQPMPGEITHDSDVLNIEAYEANESDYLAYGELDETERVHHGLFIETEEAGAVYGFTYSTDVDGIGANDIEMTEGWNVVSSNFNINEDSDVSYDTDLSFSSDPAADDDDVRIWELNEDGTTVSSAVDEVDDPVEPEDAYYVYMHESNDRPIVEPGYVPGEEPDP